MRTNLMIDSAEVDYETNNSFVSPKHALLVHGLFIVIPAFSPDFFIRDHTHRFAFPVPSLLFCP